MRRELPPPTKVQLVPPPLIIVPYKGLEPLGEHQVPASPTHSAAIFDDAWTMEFDVVVEDDQLVIDKVTFSRHEGQPSLGTACIEAVFPLEPWVDRTVGQQVWAETEPDQLSPLPPREGAEVLRARRSRRKIDDAFLRDVARVYRESVTAGYSAPSEAVAEHFHVSRPQGARYVSLARKKKFLGKATPGRRGES